MGTRQKRERQQDLWIAVGDVVQSPGNAFCDRLNHVEGLRPRHGAEPNWQALFAVCASSQRSFRLSQIKSVAHSASSILRISGSSTARHPRSQARPAGSGRPFLGAANPGWIYLQKLGRPASLRMLAESLHARFRPGVWLNDTSSGSRQSNESRQ